MKLSDLVKVQRTQSAIVLESGLGDKDLAATFMPTQAAIGILKIIEKAVQPDAISQSRALNLYGTYGAGKSRLAVLVGQMLKDGVGGSEFEIFLKRLTDIGEKSLALRLKNTFLPSEDEDARPYFVVPIFGNQAGSLQAALVEALYRAIKESSSLSPDEILRDTAFDVAADRLSEMLIAQPSLADQYLPGIGLGNQYNTVYDLKTSLQLHDGSALDVFCAWHKLVTLGSPFSPEVYGAKSFIDVYVNASTELKKHNYRGIAVIWDELGNALEDMLNNNLRQPQTEIFELQNFIEKVCQPATGHTLFIGLTHVGLAEYGPRQNAAEGMRQRLETIEGRFTSLKVELKAAESEGYHLLAAQTTRTEAGLNVLDQLHEQRGKLVAACSTLNLFVHLSDQVDFIAHNCYPLHPVAAAGLLALSNEFAAATRTAFNFLPALEDCGRLEVEVDPTGLYSKELIRVHELVEYYSERMRTAGHGDKLDTYLANIAQVASDGAKIEEIEERENVLSIVLLSSTLGSTFQASDEFLAIALHDVKFDDVGSAPLHTALAWLNEAGLIWKNDTTGLWRSGGDGATDVDKVISDAVERLPDLSVADYFSRYPDLAHDVLPMLGNHYLDPSPAGIVRSYSVDALSVDHSTGLKVDDQAAAKVVILLHSSLDQLQEFERTIFEKPKANIFYWFSFSDAVGLNTLSRRYLGLSNLLSQSHNEGTRIRLQAKFDSTRNTILQQLSLLYGREGLQRKTSKILQQGHNTPVDVSSWTSFKSRLQLIVDESYGKELRVRSPQKRRNVLGDVQQTDSAQTVDIVSKILDFSKNNAWQDDLLGLAEGSEAAAVVDGVLGANKAFIKRPTGWALKKPDELEGNLADVVGLIRSTLLRRRDKPFSIAELGKDLCGLPYGIPLGAIPIFVAFALQDDANKLIWLGVGAPAKNICNGLVDGKIGVRFGDFTTNQLNVLEVVKSAIDKHDPDGNSWEANANDRGRQCLEILRSMLKSIAPETLKNNKLDKRLKELSEAFKSIGLTSHDLVDRVSAAIDPQKVLTGSSVSYDTKVLARDTLLTILNDYARVEDELRFEIIQAVKKVVPAGDDQVKWSQFLEKLALIEDSGSIAASILSVRPLADFACIKVVESLGGSTIATMSPLQIGVTVGDLQRLIDKAQSIVFTDGESSEQDEELNELLGKVDNQKLGVTISADWKSDIEQIIIHAMDSEKITPDTIRAFLSEQVDKLRSKVS